MSDNKTPEQIELENLQKELEAAKQAKLEAEAVAEKAMEEAEEAKQAKLEVEKKLSNSGDEAPKLANNEKYKENGKFMGYDGTKMVEVKTEAEALTVEQAIKYKEKEKFYKENLKTIVEKGK